MKGIVVEYNDKDSVVLTEDGLFLKVKNQNHEIGQAIMIKKNKKPLSKFIAGAASLAAAFAVCTIGAFAYFTPTDYVSLDVNPSVEYSINRFDRILDVKAVNDDGEEILSDLDLNNMTIEEAVKETLDKLMMEGYLTDDPNGRVIITTSNDDLGDAEELAAELEQEIQAYLDSQEGIAAEVDAEAVESERVREARAMGVTAGKLNLIEKLQASTSSAIDREEWLAMPVKEINKAIKENREMTKTKGRERTENVKQHGQETLVLEVEQEEIEWDDRDGAEADEDKDLHREQEQQNETEKITNQNRNENGRKKADS